MLGVRQGWDEEQHCICKAIRTGQGPWIGFSLRGGYEQMWDRLQRRKLLSLATDGEWWKPERQQRLRRLQTCRLYRTLAKPTRTEKLGNREGWLRKGVEFEVSGLFIFSWRCPGALGTWLTEEEKPGCVLGEESGRRQWRVCRGMEEWGARLCLRRKTEHPTQTR